jgi:hypothetical protein
MQLNIWTDDSPEEMRNGVLTTLRSLYENRPLMCLRMKQLEPRYINFYYILYWVLI